MCTLSYLLTHTGYELFFNRDEQHNRPLALIPDINAACQAIFPIDPQGKGTWLAVNKSGLSLALLNYYQVGDNSIDQTFISRGQLIPYILKALVKTPEAEVSEILNAINLSSYQPFQLAIFPKNLTKTNAKVDFYQWDSEKLTLTDLQQPFTSSGVDFEYIAKQRKDRFNQIVCPLNATREQFKAFHLSQENEGKYSVNMIRFEARTVSISHIFVENSSTNTLINSTKKNITFSYFDNVNHQHHQIQHHK